MINSIRSIKKSKTFLNIKNLKKINKYIFQLKNILNIKQQYQSLYFLLFKQSLESEKPSNGFSVVYIIHFSFSATNTLLHVTDTSGNLKFCHSAGSVNFKGKQKKVRIIVLSQFFRTLMRLKMNFLKNKPVVLHLSNVGFYKSFIIRHLKRYFYIRIVKNYDSNTYNGCRKKKKIRKRQRSHRR